MKIRYVLFSLFFIPFVFSEPSMDELLETLEKTSTKNEHTLLSMETTARSGEDIFYSGFKWEFVDEKILDEIEVEKSKGFSLTGLKILSALPSMLCLGAAFNGKVDKAFIPLFIGGLTSTSLPVITHYVAKNYKHKEARYKVFKNIADNIDKYEQYLPEELLPIFIKMKNASEKDIRAVLPRLSKRLEQLVIKSLSQRAKSQSTETSKFVLDCLLISGGYIGCIWFGI